MNKKKLVAMLVAGTLVVGSAVAFAGCGPKGDKVTVWVSETEGVSTLTKSQADKFMKDNPEYKDKFYVTVEGISEGEAATNMVTDVASGADVFCYAQDQMGRLIEAKALSKLGPTSAKFVQDNNDAGAVAASTVGTDVYSYPVTSDNGYFMYYNKDVVKTDVNDLASIVADCEAAGQNFSFELKGSAWYTASFFFGAGCTSTWTFDATTNKWKASDDFGDETKGLIALKGMQILTNSEKWVDSSKAADFSAATKSAVVISGTWDAATATEALGDKLGVAKLPKYTVDGKDYQLGSYSGYKLMGVKPQTDSAKAEFCHKLAQYLTNKDSQQARLDQFSWGPSNKEAAASEKAQSNLALKGLAAQAPYSTPQGQIHGGWWDFAKALGDSKGKDENGLKGMLTKYKEDLAKYEQMSPEAVTAYGVVGKIASLANTTENLSEKQDKWEDWKTDFAMTKSEKDGKVIWKTVKKIVLAAGDAFQVRKGQAWSTQYGKVEDDGFSSKSDFVIDDTNKGEYYIVLTITDDGKDTQKGVVSLSAE